MDPEDLLRQIRAARARGRSDAEIEARLQEATGGQFSSIASVQDAAGGGQGPSPAPGILGTSQGAARSATATSGATPPAPDVRANLFQQAQAALERGRSPEEVNARIAETTNGQFQTVEELDPDKSTFAGIYRVGRLAGEVFTLGGLDELSATLRGLVEGAGAVVPGGRSPGEAFTQARDAELRASRERLRRAQAGAGPGTKALGFGAGLIGPALPIRAAGGATRAARFGIPALRGAATGGAEGAAAGALSADPDPDLPLSENLRQRGQAAKTGGAIGTAAGGILGPVAAGRAASKAKPTAGARLGEAARRESDLTGRASTVRRDVRQRKRQISREQFKPLEELGEIEHPAVRGALQADDVKPIADDLLPEEVLQGSRDPTFLELQKVKDRLEGLRDRAVRAGDSFDVNKFGNAADEVVEAIGEAIPDRFPQAQRAWARESARIRALEEGRKLMKGGTADDIQSAFRELDDPVVEEAMKEGLATEFVARVEDLSQPKAVIRQIENSPQLRAKLEVLFGGEDALERFTREALAEGRLRNRAQLYERVKRWAGLAVATGAAGGAGAEGVRGILGN